MLPVVGFDGSQAETRPSGRVQKRHHNATTHVLRFVWMFHRFQSCFDDFSVGFFKTHVLIFSVVFHAAV